MGFLEFGISKNRYPLHLGFPGFGIEQKLRATYFLPPLAPERSVYLRFDLGRAEITCSSLNYCCLWVFCAVEVDLTIRTFFAAN